MGSPVTDRRLGLAGNAAYKAPATAVAAVNVVQSGEQTIDGVAVLASNAAGVADRVLCVAQTDATTNGLWDVQTGAWSRSVDANGNYDFTQGTQVLIANGASKNAVYALTTPMPLAIGSTLLNWITLTSAAILNFIQTGAGAVLRAIQDRLRESVSVMDFSAIGDGVADDSAAFAAAFAILGTNGGTVTYPYSKKFFVSNLTIPANCTLRGPSSHWGITGFSGSALLASLSSIQVASVGTISLGAGATIDGCLIYRAGMAFPAADQSSFAGVALTASGDDVSIFDSMILGFVTAYSSINFNRPILVRVLFDCVNGVLINNCGDVGKLHACHGWPFSAAPGTPQMGTQRGGFGFQLIDVGDWTKVTDCFSFNYFRGFNVSSADHCVLLGCGADGFNGFTNSIGILIDGTSRDTALVACQAAAHNIGIVVDTTATLGNHHTLTDCQMWGNDAICVQVVSGDTHIMGGQQRSTGIGLDVQSTTSTIFIDGVRFEQLTGAPINMSVSNPTVYIGELNDFGGASPVVGTNSNRPLPSIASATTLPVPANGNRFKVTGTTTITGIFNGWAGREITLVFSGSLTVTHSATLYLKGATNRSTGASSTMKLVFDGTNWYEI